MGDFNVDTEGHCFFCFEKTTTVKLESASESRSAKSLQYLSLYLKMNRKKVFNDEELISPELLAKVEKSRLKSELCAECAIMNQQFSKLFRHLEMTELKMALCLERINMKFLEAEERSRFKEIYTSLHRRLEGGHELSGKLQVVEGIRTEAMTKCAQKLNGVRPRVKVRKMAMKEVNLKKSKLKHDLRTGGGRWTASIGVKEESVDESLQVKVIDGDDCYMEVGPSGSADYDVSDYFEERQDDAHLNDLNGSHNLITKDNETYQEGEAFANELVHSTSSFPETKGSRISYRDKFTIDSQSGKHVCRDCSRQYSSLTSFQLHYRCEHLKIRYKCRLCGENFKQLVQLNRHQKSVHKLVE